MYCQKSLTATECTELLCVGYTSAVQVWRQVRGRESSPVSAYQQQLYDRGHLAEAQTVQRLLQQCGHRALNRYDVQYPCGVATPSWEESGGLEPTMDRYISCTPDLMLLSKAGKPHDSLVVEIKTVTTQKRWDEAPHPNHVLQLCCQLYVVDKMLSERSGHVLTGCLVYTNGERERYYVPSAFAWRHVGRAAFANAWQVKHEYKQSQVAPTLARKRELKLFATELARAADMCEVSFLPGFVPEPFAVETLLV